jgi:hypothetical protein
MRLTRRIVRISFICLAIASVPALRSAAQALGSGSEHPTSKLDIYAGYGYFHPVDSTLAGYYYQDIKNPNATASIAKYFNKWVGAQVEGSYFSGNGEHKFIGTCYRTACSQSIYTAQAGPIVRFPVGPFVPFVHALGGGAKTNGAAFQNLTWGWGLTAGGGVDLVLPYWNSRFAVRAIQADFQHDHTNYGPVGTAPGGPANSTGGIGNLSGIKLSAGLVVRFGQEVEVSNIKFGCSASPVTIFPGDPVVVTGTVLNVNPKLKPAFTWSSNGGQITSNGASATIATADLAPGEYTVIGHVTVGRGTKHQAFCTTPFTVQAFEPPTLACAASPSTVEPGTPVEINCKGKSPQNRPLTYSGTTTGGQLTMNGSSGVLSTAGLSPGTVTVNCSAVDDLAQTAKCAVVIAITEPPHPEPKPAQQLCTLSFVRDKRRPVRVDNEAKGCLDDIALTLNSQSDAKLVMVGNAAKGEKITAAEERALNASQYLTQEKGIDPSRISVRTGTAGDKSVTNTLVPAGATFDGTGTNDFDAKKVVRRGQAYGIAHPKAVVHKRKPVDTP